MAVGETVLGALLQVVFDRLASREVLNLFKRSKFDESLVEDLKTIMLAANKLLVDAEDKQMSDHTVKLWLDELKHWFYRAEEVVDEISTEALRSSLESPLEEPQSFGNKVWNLIPAAFSSSSSFEKSITLEMRIISKLEKMISQKDALGLREVSMRKAPQRVPTTCFLEDSKVYGRDKEREDILEFLRSEGYGENSIGVVAIVGMGGLGKTTLAKLVYNDERLEGSFDLKAWVCVSDQFDIFRVTKSILDSISGQPCSDFPDLEFLQLELSRKLAEKRFLFVLDDVWNDKYEDWILLRAPFLVSANGSKIIITTRHEKVASTMRTTPPVYLQCLSDDDGWFLFSRHAFELGNSTPNTSIELVGRKIVHKCKGLPLAIKALGGLLRSEQDINKWEDVLESSLWDSCDKSNVTPALWVSNHYLPPHLKRCFSFCAIFPKDHKIDKQELVLLWMAEGFLLPRNATHRIEDVGDEHLHELLSRSFLEQMDESYVTMHDLMHDLAQAVSGEYVTSFVLDDPCKISERSRHISYSCGEFDGLPKFEAILEAKFLRTFIQVKQQKLDFACYVSHMITLQLMPQLHYLRALSLSNYINLLIPESIGDMKQLRLLDVSGTRIKQLPESVSTLYNLQTLVLANCICLERLPVDMRRLVSLRHVDIQGTVSLVHMPEQMSKLKGLQILTDFVVGKHDGAGIQELKELQEMHGKLTLRQLQNVTAPEDAKQAGLSFRECLFELAFEFGTKDNEDSEKGRAVLENLEPHTNLKRLSIRNYAGTTFPRWFDAGVMIYRNITFLCLSACRYCLSLPPLGQLPCLKQLEIEEMDYIEAVGNELYGCNRLEFNSPFPALEILIFRKMKGWEVWSTCDVDGSLLPFPCLQRLFLFDCPKLNGNLPVHIPSLEKLVIERCDQLGLSQVSALCGCTILGWPKATWGSVSHLTSLSLVHLPQLVELPQELVRLSSVTHLSIKSCENLRSLANVVLPPKLEDLKIEFCRVVEFLPQGMLLLNHLRSINLVECPCLRSTPADGLPSSLNSFGVSACGDWELGIPMERMHCYTSLESLYISKDGGRLVSFPLGIFPNLNRLYIGKCYNLERVYIPEEIIGSNISTTSLMSLSSLWVWCCPKVEIIGKATACGAATVLPAPNLTSLSIWGCENLKPVLIRDGKGFHSDRLKWLSIGNFDKMTSHWSPRSLLGFSSLTILTISEHHAERFPGEGSLPTSLEVLQIEKFLNLRNLDGKALKSLTSLQQLKIWYCPKLQGLPEEGLPLSLGHLEVRECPILELRCQKETGPDWPKIAHLPCVQFY